MHFLGKRFATCLGFLALLSGFPAAAAQDPARVAGENAPVPGCILWLDAGNKESLIFDENQRITEWRDRSKRGRDVRQTRAERRPEWKNAVWPGSAGVVFSGSEWLASAVDDSAPVSGFSVFVVSQTSEEHPLRLMGLTGNGGGSGTEEGMVLGWNDRDMVRLNNCAAFAVSDGQGAFLEAGLQGDARKLEVNRTLAPRYPTLLSAVFQAGGNPGMEISVQGNRVGKGLPAASESVRINPVSRIAVGAANDRGEHPFSGALAEVLVFDRALAEGEREQVEKWLTARHGLKKPEPFVFDERAHPLALSPRAQAATADGVLLYMSRDRLFASSNGETWSERFSVKRDPHFPDVELGGGLLAETSKGTLVLIIRDRRPGAFIKLTAERGKFNNGEARSDIYAFRSTDGGRTWRDGQRIQTEYCGAMRDIKITGGGNVVVSLQAWDPKNERHVTKIHTSVDDGVTYRSSVVDNEIGRGLHDGFFESTLVERRNGTLWLLGRTALGVFWESWSKDGGLSWSRPEATEIEAGSYPGNLLRLKNGRLVLAWNRYYPAGYPGRDDLINIAGVSWYWGRQRTSRFNRELSVMISSDDGRTWSDPVVIAAGRQDFSALAYPWMLEGNAGEIFLWAGPIAVKFQEADF